MFNFIRALRRATGLTQQKFADLVATSQPTIAQYESGVKSPTLSTAHRMAKECDLDIFWQFTPRMKRSEYRSLLYHERIVEKLREQPDTIRAHAHAHIERMTKLHPHACKLYNQWMQWLDLPLDSLCMHIMSLDEHARDMRQVSPFAGLLSPDERKSILKRLRKELI